MLTESYKHKTERRFSEEHKRKISEAHKGLRGVGMTGKKHTKATKRKMREAKIGRTASDKHKKAISESVKKSWTDKRKSEARQAMKKLWMELRKDGRAKERNKKISKARVGQVFSQSYRQNISEATKKLWQNPDYVAKQMKARNVKPNKPEKQLDALLERILSNEYKFVGAGEFILAGKCPDFVNVNGQKKIIELYGDYWHRNDNPQDRVDLFAQYGWDTLIIWEKELTANSKLKQKLIEFNQI